MPDEKISQLPPVTTVVAADLGVAVASNVTSKITQQQLINALVSFITANVNVGAGKNLLNTDGSAIFANNQFVIASDGSLVIHNTSVSQNAFEVDANGQTVIMGSDGTVPLLTLTLGNQIGNMCSLICSPNPNDNSLSASFGADPQGCFAKVGSSFNTFQIRNDSDNLGNISVAIITLSQLGGGALAPTCGTAQLNGTTPVVVPCATIAADSLVFLTINGPAGTLGCPVEISASRIASTSFSIRSTVALDTSTVAWWVVPNADTF